MDNLPKNLKILEREIVPPGIDQFLIPIIYFLFIYLVHKLVDSIQKILDSGKWSYFKILSDEFLASFSVTSLILIKYDWDMYFGSKQGLTTAVGCFLQCLFLAEISSGVGDPVLYYFSEMVKSNGFVKFDKQLYNIFAVQIAGSIIGGIFISWIWSFEISKMHWMHTYNYFDVPSSSLTVGIGYGVFLESTGFFLIYLAEKVLKYEKISEKVNSKIKNVLMSLAITGAVMLCVNETGAPLSPALALGMNLYIWQKDAVAHLLVFWICPAILMHWLAKFETVGKKKLVSKDRQKMIKKIKEKLD